MGSWRLPSRVLAAFLFAVVALVAGRAAAGPPIEVPVIGEDGAKRVGELYAPLQFGDDLADGWTLYSATLGAKAVLWIAPPGVGKDTPDEAYASVEIRPASAAGPGFEVHGAVAVEIEQEPEGSRPAIEVLLERFDANPEVTGIWKTVDARVDFGGGGEAKPSRPERPKGPSLADRWRGLGELARDGLVYFFVLVMSALLLAVAKLKGEPRWVVLTLVGVLLVGAAIRIGLSPRVPMAPFPYGRFVVSAQRIGDGPVLSGVLGHPVWTVDLIHNSNLAFALLAPLAAFVHARLLLDDTRAALLVAGLIAVLPLHVRFSRSDSAFVASITTSSVAFALVHAATRDQRRWLRWLCALLALPPMMTVYLIRPLNIMYFPLFLATALVNDGAFGSKARLHWDSGVGVLLALLVATIWVGVPHFFGDFGDNAQEGLSLNTLLGAWEMVLQPIKNATIHPTFTPIGVTALAIAGAITLWKRKRRSLFAFLAGWLVMFFVAHGYVVVPEAFMQSRYHLHLVVPYVLLAGVGLEALLRDLESVKNEGLWLNVRRAKAVRVVVLAYLAASPLLHLRMITRTDFSDMQEFTWLLELRPTIPEGCTVVEYAGHETESRFMRVGDRRRKGGPADPYWNVIPITYEETSGGMELPEQASQALRDDACVVFYIGLPCVAGLPSAPERAPVCGQIAGRDDLRALDSIEFESHSYHGPVSLGIPNGTRLELAVYGRVP